MSIRSPKTLDSFASRLALLIYFQNLNVRLFWRVGIKGVGQQVDSGPKIIKGGYYAQ